MAKVMSNEKITVYFIVLLADEEADCPYKTTYAGVVAGSPSLIL
jgi:hypothetical protein